MIGNRDAAGRLVIGSLVQNVENSPVKIPEILMGDQVTLIGSLDTAKMVINATNAFNSVSPNEPTIVTALAEAVGQVPRWGGTTKIQRRRS